ncbi:MAG: Phosphate/sulfate permease PitA [Candidatus Methanohalarchaeum thermophilum]|uniref:Phosphate/sulfate permease PitA n=1 Tax=Methanohalarchaeum thermophilum TaxID=1903181 RepID=A0A1Q6DSA0_METT1|nr:MAG: Phosphate/sulfate permease PitA [Candidatus Methanohalarchaeum thermophilum]
MDLLIVFLAFLGGLFTSWVIGVNNASSFGPVTSSGAISILTASMVVGIMSFIGAITQGGSVANTIGKELVTGISITPLMAAVVLITASSLIVISIILKYPMPSVFTLTGSVLGVGLAAGGSISFSQFNTILVFWLGIPPVAIIMGYFGALVLRKSVDKENREDQIKYVLLLIGVYTAYTAGANRAGLAIGPLLNVIDINITYLLVFAGIGMTIGAWTGSPRIIESVSREYSRLGPRRAVSALFTTSVLAQIATYFGVPISFNEAIISSIIGSGLVAGKSGISKNKITKTVIMWILAFIISILASYGVTYTLIQ